MKFKIALIGCGYWGEKLLRYLQENKHFEVVAVCNSKTDLQKIWSQIEAVVIATPIDTHYRLTKEALFQGKHVFVEKPLALTGKECLELKSIAKKKGLILTVEYTQTFSRSLKKAKELDVGQIQAIQMTVKHLGRFLDWDVYWLLGSHCLSILDMFVPLKKLKFSRNDLLTDRGLTRTGVITFWNKQIRGQISLSLNFPGKEYQVIIYGQKGTIIYNPVVEPALRAVWYKKTPKKLPPGLISKKKSWQINEGNNLKHAIDHFCLTLIGKATPNLETAIRVSKILEGLSQGKNL